jgi:hypothetical protein
MKVIVNDESLTLGGDETLNDLLQQLQRHQPGTALARIRLSCHASAGRSSLTGGR